MKKTPIEWEKEFDILWRDFEEENVYGFSTMGGRVKSFISSLLQKQIEEVREKIKGMEKEMTIELQRQGETIKEVAERQYQNECNIHYYNQALSDILKELEKE